MVFYGAKMKLSKLEYTGNVDCSQYPIDFS